MADEQTYTDPSVTAQVQKWCDRVKRAKQHFTPDFDRMCKNMEFVAGLQWNGQEELRGTKYVADLVLRTLNQKKSVLYAKNPKAEFVRRERLDFQLWDGKMETIMSALQSASVNPLDIQALAVLNDYMMGMQRRQVVDKIGETLKLMYMWNVDEQEPTFKTQMKDLVGRVLTCGVGYVKLSFVRGNLTPLTPNVDKSTQADRMQRLAALMQKVQAGEIQQDDPEVQDLLLLANSLQVPSSSDDSSDVQEKLIFDFLPATSVIVDPACRTLRGFAGARWIAQEYDLPITEAEEYFQCDLQNSSSVKLYSAHGTEFEKTEGADKTEAMVRVWEIFDKRTMSHFFVCDGYKAYMQPPEPVVPQIKHFWPIFPLVFNPIECVPGLKVTIYPPSDVDLLHHAQKEWNRTREALREHRKANVPKYLTSAELSQEDIDKIESAQPHSVIKLNSLPSGADVSKLFIPIQHVPVNPMLYDTSMLQTDILQTAGLQEANLGPITGNETATGQTIAEQSRMTAASSNVDDLDDFLSLLALSGGEMLMREASEATAKHIVGAGALFPEAYREEFLSDIYLKISAASSGRPNKAIDVANYERIAPLLMQAGANPQALIREGVKRLDDSIDISQFFPIAGLDMGMQQQGGGIAPPGQLPGQTSVPQPQQPLQALPSQSPVPLAGA